MTHSVHRALTQEFVRNNEGLIRLQEGRIRHAVVILRVMVELVPTEVPSPAELVVANQTLITDTVKRRVRSRDSHHGVGAPLPRAPLKLPYVHALGVAHLPSYAICTLRNWVSVKR